MLRLNANGNNGKNAFLTRGRIIKCAFFAVMSCISMSFLIFGDLIPNRFANSSFGIFLFLSVGLGVLLVNILYFAWQILLAMQYKEVEPPSDDKLPTCAVIVPAYNEGRQVAEALKSVLASDYPAGKLEIITVNDGSVDDTWEWMKKTSDESNGRIKAVNMPRNGGKRKALAQGIMMTDAEVVITIDSDSIVMPDTVKRMVAPFVADETIGGVAGNVRVLNVNDGMIPKMLDVSFVFSFDFLRAAQSMVRAVLCTPGALSAYRRSTIMPHLNDWVNEKFMGAPANIGEDRALTNLVLKDGYGVVFQRGAVVYTEMPVTYSSLCKMLIRWGRSNVRENLSMTRFAFDRIDLDDADHTGMQINLIVQMFWMIAPLVFSAYSVSCFINDAPAFIFGASFAIIFWSTMPAFIYAGRNSVSGSIWAYVYGFYSFLTLCWVSPYCIFTVNRSGWLTREKTSSPADAKAGVIGGLAAEIVQDGDVTAGHGAHS